MPICGYQTGGTLTYTPSYTPTLYPDCNTLNVIATDNKKGLNPLDLSLLRHHVDCMIIAILAERGNKLIDLSC